MTHTDIYVVPGSTIPAFRHLTEWNDGMTECWIGESWNFVKGSRRIWEIDLCVVFRERSLLTLGTRAEDNFAQLEKISYPILNIETVFVPHHPSAKQFSTHLDFIHFA